MGVLTRSLELSWLFPNEEVITSLLLMLVTVLQVTESRGLICQARSTVSVGISAHRVKSRTGHNRAVAMRHHHTVFGSFHLRMLLRALVLMFCLMIFLGPKVRNVFGLSIRVDRAAMIIIHEAIDGGVIQGRHPLSCRIDALR